ncbi:MAG: IS5 family transposase [Planctomycetota bacterium]
MNSRVHPKYKTKYRVSNWREYDRGLVRRGKVTFWLSREALAAWSPHPGGRRGGQRRYSDLAIETALTLRLVFHLPLRQVEGFLCSLFDLMGVELDVPDHTTLSRRSKALRIDLRGALAKEPVHLIVDSTGLSIVGEGEWAAVKHGGKGKRGWRKLHLAVDRTGVMLAQALTPGNADDAAQAGDLLEAGPGQLASFTADAAYDTGAVYEAAKARGAHVIVPPVRNARPSGRRPRSRARDRTVRRVRALGRRRWMKASGYHRQATVENTFFRYKTILGSSLRAQRPDAQQVEARIACNVLNRMLELTRPASYAIGA